MTFTQKFWKAFSSISIPVIGWLIYTVFAYWNDGESKHIVVALIMLLAAFIFTSIRIAILNKRTAKE